jgi:hypothetical protein
MLQVWCCKFELSEGEGFGERQYRQGQWKPKKKRLISSKIYFDVFLITLVTAWNKGREKSIATVNNVSEWKDSRKIGSTF